MRYSYFMYMFLIGVMYAYKKAAKVVNQFEAAKELKYRHQKRCNDVGLDML